MTAIATQGGHTAGERRPCDAGRQCQCQGQASQVVQMMEVATEGLERNLHGCGPVGKEQCKCCSLGGRHGEHLSV
eukprot:6476425-Amphidinium_carterae.1